MSGPGSERDPTERFGDRVQAYARHRPDYPAAVYEHLTAHCALTAQSIVADVGAGTGIFSAPWLERGHRVWAVEPNAAMRAAARTSLARFPRLRLVDGRAEALGLDDASVDLLCAAQAFHWFDPARARGEFARALAPGGWVALVWNERDDDATPFARQYEALLERYAIDYAQIARQRRAPGIEAFFAPEPVQEARFPHRQRLDFEALWGRLQSASYAPGAEHPNHAPLLRVLRVLFEAHASDGHIAFEYCTRVFTGRL